jgi:hypothetical protein
MDFAIGFVSGGLLIGLAAAKSGTILKAAHEWLGKAEMTAKQEIAAKAASLKSKI